MYKDCPLTMSNPAIIPVPVTDVQGDGRWMSIHNRFLRQARISGSAQVLFIGDSLIQQMEDKEVWDELFKPLNAVNFGIGADTTQHVLWRVQNGEIDSMSSIKVVVVLVGTNNHGNTADQVVEGIEAVTWSIQSKLPSAKIIVLGLLPRGEKPNLLRDKHFQVNHTLKDLIPAIPNAHYLDADPGFVKSDGIIFPEDMYDYLHMTRRGYRKFCKPIYELVMRFLKYS